MRVAFFEDAKAADFESLTLTRPVFELVCGRFSLRERFMRSHPNAEWGAFIRDYLQETYAEEHPAAHVNDYNWLSAEPTLLLNGRWLTDPSSLDSIDPQCAAMIGDEIVALIVKPDDIDVLARHGSNGLPQIASTRRPVAVGGALVSRPWDLVDLNPLQLTADFQTLPTVPRHEIAEKETVVGPREQLCIDPTADINPFVMFDTRSGPITIGANVVIQAFSRLEGPCHIGRDSQLFQAKIRAGTTIGPCCRIGGEIEACIFQGYSNKCHDGFLGHSYVGRWVNLGAETTCSDLKNDYSSVRVPLAGEPVDTGLMKVGCFIGDHTKTGLGTLFNTGSSIGVMSMILPSGELAPKFIPSFSSLWHGKLTEKFSLERSIEAARIAMSRRDHSLTPTAERLLKTLYERTATQRSDALSPSQLAGSTTNALKAV